MRETKELLRLQVENLGNAQKDCERWVSVPGFERIYAGFADAESISESLPRRRQLVTLLSRRAPKVLSGADYLLRVACTRQSVMC